MSGDGLATAIGPAWVDFRSPAATTDAVQPCPRARLSAAVAAGALVGLVITGAGLGLARHETRHATVVVAEQARAAAHAAVTARQARIAALSDELARRDAALDRLIGAAQNVGAETPSVPATDISMRTPAAQNVGQTLGQMRQKQDAALDNADQAVRSRAERLFAALRMAGLNPSKMSAGGDDSDAPIVPARDPHTLAAVLRVDEPFAARILHAARDLTSVAGLSLAAGRLPLATPVSDPVRSSGFGVRSDPFTEAAAFHAGQDFAGAYMTPVQATGPGVVSFVGQHNGYGNTVEIDHGGGFKTRYAHLAAFAVRAGQRVGVGQRIGGMGSTGRSTGTHLHYEVWVNGRVQNPDRFLRAGEVLNGDVAPTAVQLASFRVPHARWRVHGWRVAERGWRHGGRYHARFEG